MNFNQPVAVFVYVICATVSAVLLEVEKIFQVLGQLFSAAVHYFSAVVVPIVVLPYVDVVVPVFATVSNSAFKIVEIPHFEKCTKHVVFVFVVQHTGFFQCVKQVFGIDVIPVDRVIANAFDILYKQFFVNAVNVAYFVHSSSKEEISTYQDSTIRNNLALKLNSYNELPSFPTVSDEVLEKVLTQFSDDANGQIDNELLKEVYSDNVGSLLTDDKLMLKKAEMLYMRDKVMTSSELLAKFESKFPKNVEYKMLAVKLVKFEEVDLSDTFFDSLREDYEGQKFDQWFKKKGKEAAYVFEDKDGLKGFRMQKVYSFL